MGAAAQDGRMGGRPRNRHSRVSGNPDGIGKTSPLLSRRRIPAYAGMTVGRAACPLPPQQLS